MTNGSTEVGWLRCEPLMDAGIHRGALTGGSFIILDFSANGRAGEPSVVYSDGLTGALYLR